MKTAIMATALLQLLLGGQLANAAEATVITLSCDGTAKIVGDDETGKPEPIKKMGLVVNLAEHTVSGFPGIVAHIDSVDATSILFSGEGPVMYRGQPTTGLGTVSVEGQIDRVTGAVLANKMQFAGGKDNKVIANDSWELFCKVTNHLF